jgi:hypothetical protein
VPINPIIRTRTRHYRQAYPPTRDDMVMSPAGLGPENDCAGEDQKQLQTTDPSSRQKGRPTLTNPQMTETKVDGSLTPKQTSRLTIGRNITLSSTLSC